MTSEREILELMRDKTNEQPRPGNYAVSNVEMFPGGTRNGQGTTNYGYPQDRNPSLNQTLWANVRGHQPPSRQFRSQHSRQFAREYDASDYHPTNPNIPTSGYGYSMHIPSDNPMLNKSKIVELGNGNYQQHRRTDDMEIRHLQ
jgi:hypothetical protein